MEKEKLKQLRIETTRKCNLRCRDCYNHQFKNRDKELSAEETINVIEDSIPIGLEIASFTGGEPLLEYEKLMEILRYSKSRGLEAGLLTNGLLANERVIRDLEKLGLDWARISLDGSNNRTNSLTRGNSFDGTLEAIKRFNASKIYTILRTTVHKGNVGNLGEIANLALKLGVPKIEFQPYILLTEEEINNKFDLSAEMREKAATELIRAKREYKGKIDISLLSGWFEFLSPEYGEDVAPKPYQSFLHFDAKKVNGLYIDAFGEIRACACNSTSLGNIRRNSIVDVFFNSPYLKDLRSYTASKYCPKCSQAELCFPCPSPRTNIHGTANASNPHCPKVMRGENK